MYEMTALLSLTVPFVVQEKTVCLRISSMTKVETTLTAVPCGIPSYFCQFAVVTGMLFSISFDWKMGCAKWSPGNRWFTPLSLSGTIPGLDSISFARWVRNAFTDLVMVAISGFVFEMIKAFDTVTSKRNQKMYL